MHFFPFQNIAHILPRRSALAHHHGQALHREVRQLRVLDLRTDPILLLDHILTAAAHHERIAGIDRRAGRHVVDDAPPLTQPLDENQFLLRLHVAFEFGDGVPLPEPVVFGLVGAEDDGTRRRIEARRETDVVAQFRFEVERRLVYLLHPAQQTRAERSQDPRRPRRTENIGHGITDGHGVQIDRLSVGQLADGVGRHAQHGGHGLRTGQQSGRLRYVVAHQRGAEPRRPEARQTDDHREPHLRQPVAFEPAEELRAHGVADRKEKEEKKEGLGRFGNLDFQLPDHDAHQQHARHRAERETAPAQFADQKTQRKGDENGQRRIGAQKIDEMNIRKHSFRGCFTLAPCAKCVPQTSCGLFPPFRNASARACGPPKPESGTYVARKPAHR